MYSLRCVIRRRQLCTWTPRPWQQSSVPPFRAMRSSFCCYSSAATSAPVALSMVDGIAKLRLPVQKEDRVFMFQPGVNVAEVIHAISGEAGEGAKVSVTIDGAPVALHTSFATLLRCPFELRIGDDTVAVAPPAPAELPSDISDLADIQQTVQRLYDALDVEGVRRREAAEKERQLAELEAELRPLQQKVAQAREQADKRTRLAVWGGLTAMGFQFGLLARLTFWEYSWDIVEPLTYFITFATAMGSYVFFALTRSDYEYRGAFDRKYVQYLHRSAKSNGLDIQQYNALLESIGETREALKRLQQR